MAAVRKQFIAEELERIQAKLYADQPDTMDTISALIDLLKLAIGDDGKPCDHNFVTSSAGGDPTEPAEMVTACEKCGMEKSVFEEIYQA